VDTLTQDSGIGGAAPEMDTDAILAEVLGSESGQTQQPTQSSNEPQSPEKEFEADFTWKGKQIKMPWSKAKAYVQKGYDYEQNIGTLKRERDEFLRERNQFGDLNRLKELKTLDDFAKQNPAFLNLVKTQWEAIQKGQTAPVHGAADGTTPAAPAFDPVQSTLQTLMNEVNQLKQERQSQELEKADSQLDTDLQTLRDTYKTLDWDKQDEFGYTREHQVLRYIQNYGVDAKKAFWALYGEEVAQAKAEETRQKTLTDVQEKHKRGKFISGAMSKAPAFSPSSKNVSDKSYDDITKSVMKEYNINY
jgi:hypothetical protein